MRTSAAILLFLAFSGLAEPPRHCRRGRRRRQRSDQRCDQCGRYAACICKTCQVVCDVKKETKTSWSVEYQEICPLMPGCHHHGDDCPPPPRCGKPKCVKKLVKKETTVEVPVYKCVVRNLCPECLHGGIGGVPQPASGAAPGVPASVPAAPPRNRRFRHLPPRRRPPNSTTALVSRKMGTGSVA